MHSAANSEHRIDVSNPFDCESIEERRRLVRCHAFGDNADNADPQMPIAEGCADFAIVWPRRSSC